MRSCWIRQLSVVLLSFATPVAFGACSGSIDGSGAEADRPGSGDNGGVGTAGGTPGTGTPATGAAPGASTGGAGAPASGPLAAPALQRLSAFQYRRAVVDLLGAVTPPSALEPDVAEAGFSSLGSAKLPVSGRGVEQYETAAYDLAHQVFASADKRMLLVGCTPVAAAADPCARKFIERFGRRAFRRPLDAAELDSYAQLAAGIGSSLGDPWLGLEHTVAAFLQTPSFLYRIELGERDPANPARLRYTSYEMASRLAFVLTETMPDDRLLDAAARGELATADGVRTQAKRLLTSPRGKDGAQQFFVEHFELERLDGLVKDRKIYPSMTATLGGSMRREIQLSLAQIASDGGDFRRLFDGRHTFVNKELSRLYGLPLAPTDTDFIPVDLPAGGARAGVFGFAGMMAMQARATATSPTLRGKFVRERLLCQNVPEPPPDVETTLPPEAMGRTLRDRLEQHRTDPNCASCHAFIDPIGLALENYDGIGAWREMDAGRPIDARGTIDGRNFVGPAGLETLLKADDGTSSCLARQLYRFASGHLETKGEEGVIAALSLGYKNAGYRFTDLYTELVASEGFRFAAAP